MLVLIPRSAKRTSKSVLEYGRYLRTILADLEAAVGSIDLDLVLVTVATFDGLGFLGMGVLRLEIQIIDVDVAMTRIAVLVAVNGFCQESARRALRIIVGYAIVAILARLGG